MNDMKKKTFRKWCSLLLVLCLMGGAARAEEMPEMRALPDDENADGQYFLQTWNESARASGEGDVFQNEDIVFESLYYDELCNLLESEGRYLIFFGGRSSPRARAAASVINDLAHEYGVEKIYHFDFRMDGVDDDTDISRSFTCRDDPVGAKYNYLYGELVSRYLTNLNRWTIREMRWYDEVYQAMTAPALEEPFLMLYDKDNMVLNMFDRNGRIVPKEHRSQADALSSFPVVCAVHPSEKQDCADIIRPLFDYIRENDLQISAYTDADYLYDAYHMGNARPSAPVYANAFRKDESINIRVVTYDMLTWLLSTRESLLLIYGGAWCPNCVAEITPLNDCAVANGVTVYMFDSRLDGKKPTDCWGYNADRQCKISETKNPQPGAVISEGEERLSAEDSLRGFTELLGIDPDTALWGPMYVNLVEKYLPNLGEYGGGTVSCTDAEGVTHTVNKMQHPRLLAVQRDRVDERGNPAPVAAEYERMFSVSPRSLTLREGAQFSSFLYFESNYRDCISGITVVISSYTSFFGRQAVTFAGQPLQPLMKDELINPIPEVPFNCNCD